MIAPALADLCEHELAALGAQVGQHRVVQILHEDILVAGVELLAEIVRGALHRHVVHFPARAQQWVKRALRPRCARASDQGAGKSARVVPHDLFDVHGALEVRLTHLDKLIDGLLQVLPSLLQSDRGLPRHAGWLAFAACLAGVLPRLASPSRGGVPSRTFTDFLGALWLLVLERVVGCFTLIEKATPDARMRTGMPRHLVSIHRSISIKSAATIDNIDTATPPLIVSISTTWRHLLLETSCR